MTQPRYQGTLKKWNAERGFGFITARDGGQDVFVHISAFARDGRQPTPGEALSFEIEPDRNGKRSAVRVRRSDDPPPPAASRAKHPARQPRLSRAPGRPLGWGRKLVVVVMLVCAGLLAYTRFASQVNHIGVAAPRAAS